MYDWAVKRLLYVLLVLACVQKGSTADLLGIERDSGPRVGTVGGMTVDHDKGYFSTAGPSQAGSNSLYGSFSPTISGAGICGLAMIVERPRLFITRRADKVAISWTTNAPGFSLQTAVAVAGAPTWNALSDVPVTSGSNYVVILPPTNATTFSA